MSRSASIGSVATVLAGIALFAVSAPPADAKGPTAGELCGRSGCVRLGGEAEIARFVSWWSDPFGQRAPAVAPFFRIVVRHSEPEPVTWTLLYVPRHDAMRITQSRVPPYRTGSGPYWRQVPLAARGFLRAATRGMTPFPASRSYSVCTVTDVRGRRPPDPATPSFNYGNETIRVALVPEDGRLVAGRLPGGGVRATIDDDGSIDAKFGWWRAGSGRIRITGRRIDSLAPPLRAHVPAGYSPGFQATGLTFPTTGCWRVTGRYAGAALTFTVRITKSPLGR